MISIIAFIVVMFGSLNWLCIGFFQYDLVAGLFGFQGSIFSRIVYIIVGICAVYLIFVIIKNKGRLTVKKLKKEEQPMIDKMTKKSPEQIESDQQIADQVIYESEHHHDPQVVASKTQTIYQPQQSQVASTSQTTTQQNQNYQQPATYVEQPTQHITTNTKQSYFENQVNRQQTQFENKNNNQ